MKLNNGIKKILIGLATILWGVGLFMVRFIPVVSLCQVQ